jgi:hypothetical protein
VAVAVGARPSNRIVTRSSLSERSQRTKHDLGRRSRIEVALSVVVLGNLMTLTALERRMTVAGHQVQLMRADTGVFDTTIAFEIIRRRGLQ